MVKSANGRSTNRKTLPYITHMKYAIPLHSVRYGISHMMLAVVCTATKTTTTSKGSKHMATNYSVSTDAYGICKGASTLGFHYKKHAVSLARHLYDKGHDAVVVSHRTGQITHMLSQHRASCSVCGNELEGKAHCPLCNALHSYI